MYRVTIINGTTSLVVHDPDPAITKPHLRSCEVIQGAASEIESCTFEIYPDNPGYDSISPFTTHVQVYDVDRLRVEFEGRVLVPTPQMTESGVVYKSVTCESKKGYLCDSVQPYTPETTYELDDFIHLILANHNAQVDDYKRIYVGNIDKSTFETTNNVTKSLNYETTWQIIVEKLIGSFGGEVQLRSDADGKLYLDYAERLGGEGTAEISLGVNLKAVSQEQDMTGVITRLIPLGAAQEDSNERLTVSEVNNGSIYVDNSEAISKFGVIVGTVTWDDVTTADALLSKAQEWIENQSVEDNVEVTALDLFLCNPDRYVGDFERFYTYRVYNPLLGLDSKMRIVKKKIDAITPYKSTFEFGSKSQSLSSIISKNNSATVDMIHQETVARKTAYERLQKAIGEGSGLYITPDKQADGSDIYYLHDQPELSASTYVIRVNSQSIAFSTDGGETYPFGFTVDGALVMDIIEANGISSDWVKFGSQTVTEKITENAKAVEDLRTEFSVENGKISSEITKVETKVDNLDIGSRNYIRNSKTMIFDSYSFVTRDTSDKTAYVGSAVVGTSTASGTTITASKLNAIEQDTATADSAISSVKTTMEI